MLPRHNESFEITFPDGHRAKAVLVSPNTSALDIVTLLDLPYRHAIFISGGAGAMSEEDIKRTREIIGAIARFAEDHHIAIIDGGTESGVMQMIGEAHSAGHYTFPLIGVTPHGKVAYPGFENPNPDAILDANHSHFVLVDVDEWGQESDLLVSMSKAISSNAGMRCVGVLINGGKIARQDVYLAVSKEVPIMVLEGSGRFADEIATAFRTGKANQSILRAILAGGDIQLISTLDGPEAMRAKLAARF